MEGDYLMVSFIQNNDFNYKNALNQQITDNLTRTTQRLALELDILRNRDLNLELAKITAPNQGKIAVTIQSEAISQSIKDILDIRKSLGIEEAAGENKPLEELFKVSKGTILDEKS